MNIDLNVEAPSLSVCGLYSVLPICCTYFYNVYDYVKTKDILNSYYDHSVNIL